jgi:hypothetical protein
VKLKIGILILFLCQIAQAQQSEMTVNQNYYNSEFTVNSEIKEKFHNTEKSKLEFKLISEFDNNEKISVFIKNNSTDSISLLLQDNSFYLLQEAKNENGFWQPIEFWEGSNCGNSFGQVRIAPNGIIETKSTKYQGNFKTQIRFKFSFDDKLYYSNELEGNIIKEQFVIPDYLNSIWPINLMKDEISYELKKKVIFLEPNGFTEFYNLFEQSRNIKKKN